jgi:hypothetical protein
MRNLLHRTPFQSAILLGLLLAISRFASAQAMVTAQRGAEIAPFVQTTVLSPDWGPSYNFGYTVGVDYTRFIRSIVQPSLEFRMVSANGNTANELSYVGGLKLETSVRSVHPYFTFLAGNGTITFADPSVNYVGPTNSFFIYSLGGGAEFNIKSQWKLRVDVTQQTWNIDPQVLTPTAVNVGIAYRLPVNLGRVK